MIQALEAFTGDPNLEACAISVNGTSLKYLTFAGEELRPIIHELQVASDLKSYTVQRNCAVAFNLSQAITGFQDIQIHYDDSGSE